MLSTKMMLDKFSKIKKGEYDETLKVLTTIYEIRVTVTVSIPYTTIVISLLANT